LVARDDWPAKLCFELFDDLEGPNGCAADEVGICIYMSVAANDCSPIIRLNSDHLTNRQEPPAHRFEDLDSVMRKKVSCPSVGLLAVWCYEDNPLSCQRAQGSNDRLRGGGRISSSDIGNVLDKRIFDRLADC
jgi:hypothetical protein